jgi:glycosyltransferase involved in cell wall biosynthesis
MAEKVAIVLPVRNSEGILERSVAHLREFLDAEGMVACEIVIADSASTDATPHIGRRLAEDAGVRYMLVLKAGKGAAIRGAWLLLKEEFHILCFMDVDMATDLEALPHLIRAVTAGDDIVVGSRYLAASRILRTPMREVVSRAYRLVFGIAFRIGVSDPQCGFKAISRRVADDILPDVASDGYFFDTELLVRAAAAGYSVKEIPVIWTASPGSSVKLLRDTPEFLAGLVRLRLGM